MMTCTLQVTRAEVSESCRWRSQSVPRDRPVPLPTPSTWLETDGPCWWFEICSTARRLMETCSIRRRASRPTS